MGDIGEYWGACPSILLPSQRCKVDGYRDQRPRQIMEDMSHG